jgi:hypothetical protein
MCNVQVADSPYKDWDRVKVSKELFDLLITHPVFAKEPKAVNAAQYWLRELGSAMNRNGGQPVTWYYRDIENRFQSFSQSHTAFRNALRDLGLLTFTLYNIPPNAWVNGECRRFTVTPDGRKLVADANYQWLYKLLKDPQIRRRNQIAASKRNANRTLYTDSISKIIDEFRRAVKFERDDLLQQLNNDRTEAPGTYESALYQLLVFETRTFCELEVKEGRIFYEFVVLPRKYKPFALFDGKPYTATLDIRGCHPTFLGRLLWEYYRHDTAAIAVRLNGQLNQRALEEECNRWTNIFTHPTDNPRILIQREAGMSLDLPDVKECLNSWLNGAKKFERVTDGRWDMKNNKRLEAWFQGQFPEMAKVRSVTNHKTIGCSISECFERPLILDPALYDLGDQLGLTLAYEYDGVGVFAERGDPNLSEKLKMVSSFIHQNAKERFAVPVVVKTDMIV